MEIIIKCKGFEHKCLIDDEDYLLISGYKWFLNKKGYAIASYVDSESDFYYDKSGRKRKRTVGISMHRFILGFPKDQQVDHINGNRLDNRKFNLRICDASGNARNRNRASNNTSGYKGVSWHKNHKVYQANIRVGDRLIYLGSFSDLISAAKAYNNAALQHFGEFANLNDLGKETFCGQG